MKFQTRYTRKDFPKTPEAKSEKGSKTVKAGYISAKQRIENILYAGQKLRDYRENEYDIDGEDWDDDNEFYDPTRTPGYDLADAFQDTLAVSGRIKAAKKVNAVKEVQVDKPEAKGAPLPDDLKSGG